MNILISTNDTFMYPTQIMIYSLCKNNKTGIDIYLMYHDLSKENIDILNNLVKKFGNELYSMDVGGELSKNVEANGPISIEAYYRILAINLLPKTLDRILYIDVDTIVKKDLAELYTKDITDVPFLVCEDIVSVLNGFSDDNKKMQGMPLTSKYFNSGVLLMNLEWLRRDNACEKVIGEVYKNYKNYPFLDQDVLNQLYYDKVEYIPWDLYNCPPAAYYLDLNELKRGQVVFATYADIRKLTDDEVLNEKYRLLSKEMKGNAYIIHFLGKSKPWLDEYKEDMPVFFDFFAEEFRKYEKELEEFSIRG